MIFLPYKSKNLLATLYHKKRAFVNRKAGLLLPKMQSLFWCICTKQKASFFMEGSLL